MTMNQAVAKGISNLRDPFWADPAAHIELYITPEGLAGPWVKLFDPIAQSVLGMSTPQNILCVQFDWDAEGWDEFKPATEKDK